MSPANNRLISGTFVGPAVAGIGAVALGASVAPGVAGIAEGTAVGVASARASVAALGVAVTGWVAAATGPHAVRGLNRIRMASSQSCLAGRGRADTGPTPGRRTAFNGLPST